MDYNISELPKNIQNDSIPAKSRTVQKSPLAQKLSSMKVNEAFMLEGADMKKVSPNLYATARRMGVKISLRALPQGVGVWRVRKSRSDSSASADNASAVAPKRRGPGRPRKDEAVAKTATNGQKRGPGRPRKDQSQPQAHAA